MPVSDAQAEKINAALQHWRQGDITTADTVVALHLANLESPLTPFSEQAAAQTDAITNEPEAILVRPLGVVVVSQTCDLVRDCRDRPYAEVCPLSSVSAEIYDQVVKRQRPRFLAIQSKPEERLVADLDRTYTVEKSVLAEWVRTENITDDMGRKEFSEALARRRSRFAFPDDFSENYARPLHNRIKQKHNRESDEGRFLRALREIRVRAAPNWDADKVFLDWWFIVEEEPQDLEEPEVSWDHWTKFWVGLLGNSAKYTVNWYQTLRLEDLTARDYLESARLDFDHLSD